MDTFRQANLSLCFCCIFQCRKSPFTSNTSFLLFDKFVHPTKNSTNAINFELENYLFLQNQKRTLIFDKSFLVNSEKVDRTEFVERQWEFVNLSPGCSLFFAPFETDKFKCGTGANTNAKEFVEEQEVLAICLWRDDVSLWAGSSIRSWQAFTRIQQATMINLPRVSQAWSFFFCNFPN